MGPGVREPRRGDGRLEPAPARPDLGRCRVARRGRPRARPAGPPARGDRAAAAARLRPAGARRAAGRRGLPGLAGRGAVLGRLAVRDAADPDDPRRAAGGPRRRGARRARGRAPGPDPSLRRPVRPAVPVLDGLAPGAVRRPLRPRRGRSTRTSTRRCCARACASSWSATSCWRSRSATSRPRRPPSGSGRRCPRTGAERRPVRWRPPQNGGRMRMWGGRFDDEPDARMADFTRSIDIDAELALDDIAGSIAHVRGLGRAGLLSDDEVAALEGGLAALRLDVEAGARRLGPDARGRAPQPRDAAHRESGTGRRQAPHRPVAQRPGRHGPAAVVPPRGGPPRRRDRRPRARAGRAGGA